MKGLNLQIINRDDAKELQVNGTDERKLLPTNSYPYRYKKHLIGKTR